MCFEHASVVVVCPLPPDPLDTVLVWRTDDPSAINLAFRQAALGAFAS
jgi:hypothetical protein